MATINGNGRDNSYIGDSDVLGDIVNRINGNGGDDLLEGGAYATNYLNGGVGNDSLVGGYEIDWLRGGDGADTLNAGSTSEGHLFGEAGDDYLFSQFGTAVTLNGGTGADTMVGGDSGDTFVVDSRLDIVMESFVPRGGGAENPRDLVISSTSFVLPDLIEDLTLSGKAKLNGTGNDAANFLQGNRARNELDGGAGADTLAGGGGSDILTGGAGRDSFLFDVKPTDKTADVIVDFEAGKDKILLDHDIFSELTVGALGKRFFRPGPEAADADDRIVYDRRSGDLFYDVDGKGGADAVKIATLEDPVTLKASYFEVV